MATLSFNGDSFTVDHAVKGADYVHGYDASGNVIVSFDGVSDFSGITYDGIYMDPGDCLEEPCNDVKLCDGVFKTRSGQPITVYMTDVDKAALKYAQVTLTTAGWSGAAPYTQTVNVTGMTADWIPGIPSLVPGDTSDEDLAAREALGCVTKITSNAGSLSFSCYEDKPTADITIRIPGLLA